MTASVDNYFMGQGIVSFSKDGGTTWIDLGNAPTFEITPVVTTKDHNSSRTGVSSVDLTVTTSKKATLKIVLDEFTDSNLAMAFLDSEWTAGTINILSGDQINGQVKLQGTNSVGHQMTVILPNVSFVTSQAIAFITSGDFGSIQLDGTVGVDPNAAVTGAFGTLDVGSTA